MNDNSLIEIIKSLNPSQMHAYLASQDWRDDGAIGEVVSVWHRTENEYDDFEIIMPLVCDIKDFTQRAYDLIKVLSDFERRPLRSVADDIINFNADVVQIQVIHEDVSGGSIPLSDGVLLVEKARELLVSIVRSTFKKQRFFSGGVSQDISELVSTFRLGQTQVGSYVVNLIMPIVSVSKSQIDFSEVSLTRSVINTLARSLNGINESIATYKSTHDDRSFDSAVEKGVSANFCDALVGLTGESKSRNINISVSLSRLDANLSDLKLVHFFDSSAVPYLERASDYYKGKYSIIDFLVSGYVTGLKHEENEVVGTVTVATQVNGAEKHITFELPTKQYWVAHHAHGSNGRVECRGDLLISPRSARLINVVEFRVLGSNDIFDGGN